MNDSGASFHGPGLSISKQEYVVEVIVICLRLKGVDRDDVSSVNGVDEADDVGNVGVTAHVSLNEVAADLGDVGLQLYPVWPR